MLAAIVFLAFQAEPAPAAPDPAERHQMPPPGAVPLPEPEPGAGLPANAFALGAGPAFRLAPADLEPRWGFGIAVAVERRIARLGTRAEIGILLDLAYHRFAKSVQGSARTEAGDEIPFDGVQVVSQSSFGALPTVALRLGRLRPFVAAGGGLSVGFFTSDDRDVRPGTEDAFVSFVRAAAGAGFEVGRATTVVLRGAYTRLLFPPTFLSGTGADLHVFGDLADATASMRFEF